MNNFAAVLFDLNETLVHQTRTEQSHVASTYAALAARRWDITFESFDQAWHRVHDRYAQQYQEGRRLVFDGQLDLAREKLHEPWYRENIVGILSELGIPVQGSNRLIAEVTWAFQDSWVGGLTSPQNNVDTLQELLDDGYQLGLVTNFQQPDIIEDILLQFGLKRFFGPIIISATVGCRKPHPDLFRVALQTLGMTATPEKVVYVGDDMEDDIAGASLAELYPVLIDTKGRHASSTQPMWRIQSLSELPAVLRRIQPRLP